MKLQMTHTFESSPLLEAEEVQFFKKNGFLILKNLVSTSVIRDIKESAMQIFKFQLERCGLQTTNEEFERQLYELFKIDREAFINCGKHIQYMVNLHQLGLSANVLGLFAPIGLKFPNICTRAVAFFNSKHLATNDIYHTVPAHQDWKSMQGSLNSVVLWFPLMNISKELGALQVVPGSHTRGLLTSSVVEGFGLVDCYKDEDFISAELDAGDALLFNSFLVHRSGINITDSIRWSCHFRYNDMSDSDFIERKFPHPYIYKPTTKL